MILTILVLAVGFYMAWNIGANDVSNAMGTSVGSGALTLRKAVIIAAVLEFSGAFFLGSNVSQTMESGLINPALFAADPQILVLGMCGALLGTSIWLQIASYFGWPVSTTHAIVGSILGFGLLIGGIDALMWDEVGSIALSWVISPLFSALIAYLIFSFLQKKVLYALNPSESAKKLMPFLVFVVFATFTVSLLVGGFSHYNLSFAGIMAIALLAGLVTGSITFMLLKRVYIPTSHQRTPSQLLPQNVVSLDKAAKHLERVHISSQNEVHTKVSRILDDVKALALTARQETHFSKKTSEYHIVEKLFGYLQILSACFVAFAHGSNDVANAIGPVAAVLDVLKYGTISPHTPIPTWLLALGGLGIVIGLATWGWRVMETIGTKITELTPTRGFCAEFGAATTILIASKLGLPISSTHCLVGAVLGIGLARGIKALNLNMLRDILLSWLITIPASAITSILLFYLLKYIFM